jgi:hypothetical protein
VTPIFDSLIPRRKRGPLTLVLYTRAGCHLCDEMKAEIARAKLGERCVLREVDVDSDPVLAELHGRSVPVLSIAGRPAFKGRLTVEDLRRKVERALRSSGSA